MAEKIIVSFSGWCEVNLDRVVFVYLGMDESVKKYINGHEWLDLPEYNEDGICRDDYILESCADAQATALDGEYEDIHVEVEKE